MPRRQGLFSVRFGDQRLQVFKDGQKIDGCYEVDVLAGLAWRYHLPKGLCECRGHVRAYIEAGNFTVTEVSDGSTTRS